jgi:hypothetical protein
MPTDLELVRAVRPSSAPPDDATIERLRLELTATAGSATTASTRRRDGWARVVKVAIAATAALVVVGGGVAVAASVWWHGAVQRTTGVECSIDPNVDTIVDSSTGDPIVDCGRVWTSEHHSPPPPMIAYDDGHGGIQVLLATAKPQPGEKPLPSDFHQTTAVLELDHELGEATRGLPGECHSTTSASRLVRTQLDRLDLSAWHAVARRGVADGHATCAFYYLDTTRREVVVFPGGPPSDVSSGSALETFDHRLSALMIDGPSARCLGGAEAGVTVTRIASALHLRPPYYESDPSYGSADAPDGVHSCVRPAMDVGGTADVHLDVVSIAQFDEDRHG